MADVIHPRLADHCRIDGECWRWTGRCKPNGYGSITIGSMRDGTRRTGVSVHRFAYELMVGPIPVGKCVLHSCDVPDCFRPSHLFVGTHLDNARDREAKGRGASHTGVRNAAARLSDTQVMAARWLVAEGLWPEDVGRMLGLSAKQARRVCSGKRWGHLPQLPYRQRRGYRYARAT